MKKSKIVIIEFETHSALLEQWFMLLNAMENIDFHFLISKKIADKLTIIPIIRFTIIENDKDISTYISGYDLIIINTFHRNFDWYSTILQKKNTLCLLHNINFSLFFNSINLKNIFTEKNYFYYYLKLYFLESIGSKRKLILPGCTFRKFKSRNFIKFSNISIKDKSFKS